jgi:formylglycine-generating enzyme required for sulfatase activity
VADESARRIFPSWTVVAGYDDGYSGVAPVGRFDPNPYGLYDLSGNLWEWVTDRYDPAYYARGSRVNPLGPATGQTRLVRGGSWRNAEPWHRVAYRYGLAPDQRLVNVGFRCAR